MNDHTGSSDTVEPDDFRLASQVILDLSRNEPPSKAPFSQGRDNRSAKKSGATSGADGVTVFQGSWAHRAPCSGCAGVYIGIE